MKKGQSAPRFNAILARSSIVIGFPAISFNARRVKDASAEPPPIPAPSGRCFSSFMSTVGKSGTLLRKSCRAFQTRLSCIWQSICRPVTFIESVSEVEGVISIISASLPLSEGVPA